MKYTDFVNVFQGSGEIALPKPEGIAAKWFFIKAGCGNTSPAAVLPFGAVSAAPFTGGYPTGYGDHKPNSHSRPVHFAEGKKLIGFSHIHQSGTGAIGYYYNYAVVTPKYADSDYRRDYYDECAVPGYYSCKTEDILCELTVSRKTAYHRYTFGSENGFVEIDFSNNGIIIPSEECKKVYELKITPISETVAAASAKIEGIDIYFAVKCSGRLYTDSSKVRFYSDSSKKALVALSISLNDTETALKEVNADSDFDSVKVRAEEIWNERLSLIQAEFSDSSLYEIFYSNLYHSFIKPSDRFGESFVYGKDKAFMTDFATLWDMYKTALPLIFMTDKSTGEDICETLLSLGEALGNIPNGFGITDDYCNHSMQARMLGAYALLTACRYGLDIDVKRMLKVIETDIFADNKKDFTVDGRCMSHTFMLDMADACALTAELARETGDLSLSDRLTPLAAQWKKVYSPETGLLRDDCEYYEGTNYNYSFRQMFSMDERIELAGGKENFVRLLDSFFGYGKPDTVQPVDPYDYEPVARGMTLGRFEGFNNESDTEAPFSYIYAGRHDRTCEILRAGMKYMFTSGRGGLPGNNDSGALSSYYVFAALGIYPLAGHKDFLIGSPFVDSAEISLSTGNTLKISVKNSGDKNIYVQSVCFNGNRITDFRIPAKELMNGGELAFVMSDKP